MSRGADGGKSFDRFSLVGDDLRFAVGYFFLFAIYGVTGPFLQVLLAALGYGSAEIGLYQGLFEAVGIAGPLLLSRWADRLGAYRPLLIATALMAAISTLPLGILVHRPTALIALSALLLMALGVRGMVPVMDAAVVAHTTRARAKEERRGRGYGVLRSVGTVGFIAMLFLTQAFHLERGSAATISAWIAGSSLLFAFALFLLPESGQGPRATQMRQVKNGRGIDPDLIIGLAIIGLGRLAMAPINSFFTLYATQALHSEAASALWAVAALAEIPALIIAGRLIERFGSMKLIALASISIALRLSVYALWPSVTGAIVGQLLHFFCYGLFLPSAVAFISSRVPTSQRAFGMALLTGVGMGFPSFLGSTLGGMILDEGGYAALFGWATLPALLAFGISLVAIKRQSR